ncbi:MAG: ABC transporter permease [Clostridia bacterium]|nr:ABC transporter permease [Clostridia bacterium]
MTTLLSMTRRNIKLFFHDKGLFFTSLITPLILLVLYVSFLGNVYKDSIMAFFPEGITVSERIVDSVAVGQLISSILSVSCVTVAFCSNMLMVQDKVTGAALDIAVTPVKRAYLSLSYYIATYVSTSIICITATLVCLAYANAMNSYIGFREAVLLLSDVLILAMLGTAVSSIINFFLSSQGQISAVGSMVSSTYGFVSGAYMPISQFSPVLQKIISLLPGTYGTSLMRNHAIASTLDVMEAEGIPTEIVEAIRDGFDLNIYFFGNRVGVGGMYAVLLLTVLLLIVIYVVINCTCKKVRK